MPGPNRGTDPALQRLLVRATEERGRGNRVLARQLLLRAVRLDSTCAAAWTALAQIETGATQAMCYRWLATLQTMEVPARPQQRRRTHVLWWSVLVGVALLVCAVAAPLMYQTRMVPGLTVAGIAVTGLSPDQASSELENTLRIQGERTVTVTAEGRTWSIQVKHLLVFDQEAVATAFAIGHRGSWLQQALERWQHIVGKRQAISMEQPSWQVIDQVAAQLARMLDRSPLNARITRTPAGFAVATEKDGQAVDRVALRSQLALAAMQNVRNLPPIEVPMVIISPKIPASQLEPLNMRLNELRQQPLWVTLDNERWPVDRTSLVDWNSDENTLSVRPSAVQTLVDQLAQAVDRSPQSSRITWEGTRIRQLSLAVPGRALDRPMAVAQLSNIVFGSTIELTLPITTQLPSLGEAEQLGLLALLGRGESQFLSYSSPNRDANVAAGGHDIDGVLIPPDGEFSFTQTVGAITWDKGYQMGEMIERGVLVPSIGGGICQVSTTVFRAALQSGLPITERTNHTWRLPWYEVDAPPGLDATIALGGPDLRFRNDTPGHVLINVETDLKLKRQTVTLYGTPMGRTVKISPLSVGGIAIQRQVVQDGVVVRDDIFRSEYTQ